MKKNLNVRYHDHCVATKNSTTHFVCTKLCGGINCPVPHGMLHDRIAAVTGGIGPEEARIINEHFINYYIVKYLQLDFVTRDLVCQG